MTRLQQRAYTLRADKNMCRELSKKFVQFRKFQRKKLGDVIRYVYKFHTSLKFFDKIIKIEILYFCIGCPRSKLIFSKLFSKVEKFPVEKIGITIFFEYQIFFSRRIKTFSNETSIKWNEKKRNWL
jgi:hypothetical protein